MLRNLRNFWQKSERLSWIYEAVSDREADIIFLRVADSLQCCGVEEVDARLHVGGELDDHGRCVNAT